MLTAHLKAADSLLEQNHHSQSSTHSSATLNQIDTLDLKTSEHAFKDAHETLDSDVNTASSTGHADTEGDSMPQQAGPAMLQAETATESGIAARLAEEQEAWGGVLDSAESMTEAVQAASMLRNALRISSVTQDGIENLQIAVMNLLSNDSIKVAQEKY